MNIDKALFLVALFIAGICCYIAYSYGVKRGAIMTHNGEIKVTRKYSKIDKVFYYEVEQRQWVRKTMFKIY